MDLAPNRPPYGSYAAIMGTFAGLLAAAGAIGRLLDRDPQCQTALDLVVLGAASFKAARTLARDEVTSFIRQPFVRGEAHSGEGEEPIEGGMAQAIGELVTCTRCAGTWVAAALASTQILAPRFGRLLTWSFAAAAANDFLQSAFAVLTAKANELEKQTVEVG
jgi:Protein of unknown function (DUF1360)